MSYFYNNKLYSYYELNESSIGSNVITKDVIEIINNEEIFFDFTNLFVRTELINVLNSSDVETIKICIDWGDGSSDRLTIPLISNKSTIGKYKQNQWKSIKHLFNVNKRYEYNTENSQFFHKITISAYNSFNDKLVIVIPYKMVYKTLYDLGSEFSLFSANTTNKNTVSYTLKQISSDSVIVVNSKDWKSILGDDAIEIIDEGISEIFSNEFINEGDMVWDWNSVPNVTLFANVTENGIVGYFTQNDIAVDEWQPQVLYINDSGDENVYVIKGDDFSFSTTQGQELKKGIYQISINPIIGINGVKGESDKIYLLNDTIIKPRELRCQENTQPFDVIDNKFRFRYSIPSEHQVKSLTKAELHLEAKFEDEQYENEDISSVINFTYDLLSPIKNNNTTNKDFMYEIPMRNIPSEVLTSDNIKSKIKYIPKIVTNDVLGGQDNNSFYNEDGTVVVDMETCPLQFGDYDIGDFTSDVIIGETDSTTNNFKCSWNFNKKDDWGFFKFKLTSIENGKIIYNTIHNYIEDKFEGLNTELINSDDTMLSYTLDGNIIPDGEYKIDLDYVVEMGDYYDYRSKSSSCSNSFTYKVPQIHITDILPIPHISYDKMTNTQNLDLYSIIIANEKDNRELKAIKLYENDMLCDGYANLKSFVKFNFNNLEETTKSYKFSSIDSNDMYNRIGLSSSAKITVNNDEIKNNLLSLPSDYIDAIGNDTNKQFIQADNNEIRTMTWVKENTLHDIRKKYRYTHEDKSYFTAVDENMCKFGEENRCPLYEIIEILDNKTTLRRFRPYDGDDQNKIIKNGRTELPSANEVINSSDIVKFPSFVQSSDLGQMTLQWKSSYDLLSPHVKDLKLKVKHLTSEYEQNFDVKGLMDYTLYSLPFGDYQCNFIINSEYTGVVQIGFVKNSFLHGARHKRMYHFDFGRLFPALELL